MSARGNRAARRHPDRVVAHVFHSTGFVEELGTHRVGMPPKQPGRHRWMAVAAYVVSDDQVHGIADPNTKTYLDHENLLEVGIACWDCEEAWTPDLAAKPCAAEVDEG